MPRDISALTSMLIDIARHYSSSESWAGSGAYPGNTGHEDGTNPGSSRGSNLTQRKLP